VLAFELRVTAGTQAWVAVRVEVPEAAAEAVANFLFENGAAAVVDDLRFEIGTGDAGARLMEVHVPADSAADLLDSLRGYADALIAFDASFGPIRVDTAAVPATDWESVFRAHHRPLAIGARLLVAPPWDVPDAGNREAIVVDPGMAFGTGQHPTTRTCLEELDALVAVRPIRSVLDVGTGTGILAAAAARLGVARVVAIDLDPSTLPVARDTLARNRAPQVQLIAGGVGAVRGRYDLVLANLLADTLVDEAPRLMRRVEAGGLLIASGILEHQADAVAAAFRPWRMLHERAEGPWRTLRLGEDG
jgi:ribosomal protein L11 methyltransferase